MKRFLSLFLVFILCLTMTIPANATGTGINDDESDTTETTSIQTTEYPDDPTRTPDLASEAALVMDVKTGTILYEKNAYIPEYPASITKIITCLLALETLSLSDTVTFSNEAVFGIERDSSNVGLDVGEVITVENCLKAMMIESANEAAAAIAEKVSGSTDAFAELMNQKAAELGCRNSNFTNPHGLHDTNHYTCAYDMALFLRAALEYPTFRTLTSTISDEIPATNLTDETRPLWNTLKMIRPYSKYYYEYLEGGKTGYTTDANCTLATYAKKGDMELICVVMNCNSRTNSYSDTEAIFEYCFQNYSYYYPLTDFSFSTAGADDNIILSNFYKSVSEDILNLSVDQDFCLVLNNSIDRDALTTNISYSQEKNTGTLAQLEFSYNGELLGSTEIMYKSYTTDDILDNQDTNVTEEVTSATDTTQDAAAGTETQTETASTQTEHKKPGLLIYILLVFAGVFVLYLIYLNVQRHRLRLRRRRRRKGQRQRRNAHF